MAKVDAPIGRPDAPPGTVERANWTRLQMQTLAKDLPKTPERFAGWWKEIISKYPDPSRPGKTVPGFRLLGDDNGKPFRTLDAFCEFRLPWGLGTPKADILAFLRAAHVAPPKSVAGVKLDIDAGRAAARQNAVDGRTTRERDESGAFTHSDHCDPNGGKTAQDIEAQRLRAITRAPDPLPVLFDAGLVSMTVAVAASTVLEESKPLVGAAAEAVIRERGAPKDEAEKRETRKAVDAAVRAAGVPSASKPDAEADFRAAFTRLALDRRAPAIRWALGMLTAAERASLVET